MFEFPCKHQLLVIVVHVPQRMVEARLVFGDDSNSFERPLLVVSGDAFDVVRPVVRKGRITRPGFLLEEGGKRVLGGDKQGAVLVGITTRHGLFQHISTEAGGCQTSSIR